MSPHDERSLVFPAVFCKGPPETMVLFQSPFPGQEVRRTDGQTDSEAEIGCFARGDPSPSRRHRRTLPGRGAAGPKSSKPLHCAMSQTQIESDS